MNYNYKHAKLWRIFLALIAFGVIAVSIIYTNNLVNQLAISERKSIEIWAESIKQISISSSNTDLSLSSKIIEQNNSIPVILVDENDNILQYRNIKIPKINENEFLKKLLLKMKNTGKKPIEIDLQKGKNYIYYLDSNVLKGIIRYPYIQLIIITIIVLLGYLTLAYSQSSEKNKLWVGLSKETAHQLGTPISSLLAWHELIKEKEIELPLIKEIEKDILRLKNISERFSKIGSVPNLELKEIYQLLNESLSYLKHRFSDKIKYNIKMQNKPIFVMVNTDLFGWVIENLVKNAVDAMQGAGNITFEVLETSSQVLLDITDTGKGLTSEKFKTIFKPGYTTKTRGWGLGLALAKRIIENIHGGKIFVKKSILNKGATFRIILNKK